MEKKRTLKKAVSTLGINEHNNPNYLTKGELSHLEDEGFTVIPSTPNIDRMIFKRSLQEIHKCGGFISMDHAYDYVTKLEDYFKHNSKVYSIELVINGVINKPQEDFLKKVNTKFEISRSLLLSFESSVDNSYVIVWRFKNTQRFFWIQVKDKDVGEFIKSQLLSGIRLGHNGLLPFFHYNPNLLLVDVEYRHLGDSRDYNLLCLSCMTGNLEVVKFCIEMDFISVDQKVNSVLPIDLAYNIKNFSIILELLKANSPFPKDFEEEVFQNNIPKELREFIEMCNSMHKAIRKNRRGKVKEIIKNNPKIYHFYNLQNESAVTCLVKSLSSMCILSNCRFRIYDTLIKRGISFGSLEEETLILNTLSRKRFKKLNEINLKYYKPPLVRTVDDNEDEEGGVGCCCCM